MMEIYNWRDSTNHSAPEDGHLLTYSLAPPAAGELEGVDMQAVLQHSKSDPNLPSASLRPVFLPHPSHVQEQESRSPCPIFST